MAMGRLRVAAATALLLAVAAATFVYLWRGRARSAVQRGYDLANAHGCFGCHGPGGLRGFEDATDRAIGDIPTFTRDELEAYVKSEGEIREWILDGFPKRLRDEGLREPTTAPARLMVMPSFRGVLSDSQVDALVTYVKAVADYGVPDEGPIAEGLEAGRRLGCFTCHGPQGRATLPNPRSLKGRIPAWDSRDFPDLARDAGEIREWILDGGPRRLREHPIARFFLGRQAIQMPAYRGRIDDADVERLVRYIQAVRGMAHNHASTSSG